MQDDTVRTAFTFAPLLRHRTSDAARRITAISLDTAAGRIFIGLASGHVEEHEIISKQAYVLDTGQPGHATRLVAEKRVSKQAVAVLSCLPTAARIAILCEDGAAFVAAYDTWNVAALQGVRTAVAMAADPAPAAAAAAAHRATELASYSSSGVTGTTSSTAAKSSTKVIGSANTASPALTPRPVRLAVAVKNITTAAKVLVYSIAPSVGLAACQPPAQLLAQIQLQEPVQELIWVGPGLFIQYATSYGLLQPGGRLTQIAEHGCSQPCMASAPWPSGPVTPDGSVGGTAPVAGNNAAAKAASAARGALLFQDSLILLTDGNGVAVVGSEPISVSEPPLAVCSSGGFMVVISDAEGLLVYDRTCSRLVQRIFWAHDDPWVAAAKRIPVAEDAGGSGGVAVATSSVVMLLQPVAPDVQARELLKRKRFDAALALIRSCRRAGEAWADTALAQAGLLLLQELRCEDALTALEEVGPATFQPAQLLPLFPRICRRWLNTVPHRPYWGLHGSLQSLDRICDDFLELRNSTTSSPRPSSSPPGSLRSGTVMAGVATAAVAATQLLLPPGASSEAGGHGYQATRHNQNHHHSHRHQHHYSHHSHGSTAAVAAVASGNSGVLSPVMSFAGIGSSSGGEVVALAADAKRHIISYLLKSRGRTGVLCIEGIDTLLVHLLVDVRDTATLEVFLDTCIPGECIADEGMSGSGGVDVGRPLPGIAGPLLAPGGGSAISSTVGCAGDNLGGSIAVACGSLIAMAAAGPLASVSPRDAALVAVLESAGRWHALAILRAVRGQVPQALELWQRLALGEVVEAPSASGTVAAAAAAVTAAAATAAPNGDDSPAAAVLPPPSDRASGGGGASGGDGRDSVVHPPASVWAAATAAVAAAAAATLMSRPARTPPLLCLSKLPWLLQAAPDWALHVLRSRPLPVADVMSLLQGRYDGVRWQYLHHLVYGGGGSGLGVASPLQRPAAEAGDGGDGSTAPGKGSPPTSDYSGSGMDLAEATGTSATIAWQMDPALHTELALELIECISILYTRSRQQQCEAQPTRQAGEPSTQDQEAGVQTEAAASAPTVFASVSAMPAEAAVLEESHVKLPPPLPPLPQLLPMRTPMVARHHSTCHDGAAITNSGPTCSPPLRPVGAVEYRPSPVPSAQPHTPRAATNLVQSHPQHFSQQTQNQQRQHRSLGLPRASPHVQSLSMVFPTPSRPPPPGSDRGGGEGAVILPYGSGAASINGVRYVSGGGGTSGAAAAAAAAAATAASSVGTAELPWLGTLGMLPEVAVARQLMLAVHAARLAAGQDATPELQLEVDEIAGASASSSDPAPAAAAFAGRVGDSLSLLRALSLRGDGAGVGTLIGLRAVLQHHLHCSKLYDASIVLQAILNDDGAAGGGGGGLLNLLLRERVQLHSRLDDHPAALAVLALQLHDVDGAINYCRVRCGQEGWLALLELLLRPAAGREPDYSAACRVLAAEGAALAPLQVLEALSDDMPLHMAHGTLSRMVGSVIHRKRQGQVLRALHRAQNLALRAELAQLQANRVVVTEETLCRGCQRPLATQIFYRYPSGVVLCVRCVRPDVDAPR